MTVKDIAESIYYVQERLRYLVYKIEHPQKRYPDLFNKPILSFDDYRKTQKDFENKNSKQNIEHNLETIRKLTDYINIIFSSIQHDNESLKREKEYLEKLLESK